ncbi:GGDEF domain-containing protein [Halobacillus halophilus]|uniref:Diguanylate cyclase domain protein n=1 Tax=Halobacillus halophilus (strain ATCC 35676 / DSM 2266 / JCM 20832 / KCTC 3685 / LMG 17431 / NBRC 102448 / NCIMB 2269) TaxID=866895 RepID=I0JTC1_HALH3|nr:GGDEF domain-containing protein [Halobacillus halophilus]ASF41305.1 GGDEF domain-containing protein [Halobacillus halophilus]CCG47393.1 diguanylate cyclase domain protein [Halobacillus halophilus DSM 2266]
MDYVVQFQVNIFAIMILAVLFIIMRAKSRVKSFSKRLLKMIMVVAAVAIVFEPLTWIFDGKFFNGAYVLEYSTNFILFLCGPVLGGLMLSYVDYHLFGNPSRVYRRWFYQHLSVLTLFILLVNLMYPVYFDVDPSSHNYISGDYKDLHNALLIGQYIAICVMVVRNRGRISSPVKWIFLIFFALPIVGMFVQLFDKQLYFSWTSIVLVVLMAYTFLESTATEQDYLTNLYNRQSYETYLQHLIERERAFGIVLIDLNDFKHINDEYGHYKGDQVLIEFGRVLVDAFPNQALAARLGGDEFIVLVENGRDIDTYVSSIHRLLEKSDDPLLQSLSFSYGYQVYQEGMSMDELYTLVDKKMYNDKRSKRSM